MHVVITKKQACKNCMKITMSSKIIEKKIHQKLLEIKNTTKMNGFRKGKVPFSIIEKNNIHLVKTNITNELMQKKFLEEIKKNNISLIGTPIYTIEKNQTNIIFTYLVDFETYPEFNLKYPQKKNIKDLLIKITDKDVKKIINQIYNKKKEIWKIVVRPIKNQDLITINYKLLINNQLIKKYNKENFQFIIGNQYLLPNIENEILGKKTNDHFTINVNFSDYHCDKFIQGKTIQINIYIQKIEEKIDYKLKSNKNINTKNNNQDHINLFNSIKEKMKYDIQTIKTNYLKKQIKKHLLKENPINIPSTILKNEIIKIKNEINKTYIKKGEPILLSITSNEEIINQVKNKIKLKLIFKKIAEMNNFLIDEKIVEQLKKNLQLIIKNNNKLNQLYLNKNFMKQIKNLALEETIYNFLIKKLNLVEKKCTFQEALNYI